jgi:hypothetical protein
MEMLFVLCVYLVAYFTAKDVMIQLNEGREGPISIYGCGW